MVTCKVVFGLLLILNLASFFARSQKVGIRFKRSTWVLKTSFKNLTQETAFNWSRWIYKKNCIQATYINLKHLNGIEAFKSLVYLDVKNNLIQNLNPLRNLTYLNHLELAFNKIESIEALKNLVKLEYLDLSSNLIKSVDSLVNFRILKALYIQKSKKSFLF
jgi:Leucine-rich repeat (LRR) protein